MLTQDEIKEALKKHEEWTNDPHNGKVMELRHAYMPEVDWSNKNIDHATLIGCSLNKSNLHGLHASEANLNGSDFSESDLSRAILGRTNLVSTSFVSANLYRAILGQSDLSHADLHGANLECAYLIDCNLTEANLNGANLTGANLDGAILVETDLSGCIGLLDPAKWLASTFKRHEDGYIVYKTFGSYFDPPDNWKIAPGRFIEEVVNPDRCTECGCGVNFATMEWIERHDYAGEVWECLIHWADLPGVVVPYQTNGKARCARLELLSKVE